jgi:hypothetical protein
MNNIGSSLLIGDLLRSAKIVELHDLTNAVQVASKTGLPVGRVLVMLGLVTSETVHAALQAQSLVRDRLISAEVAAKALSMVASYRIDLERALEHMGSLPCRQIETNKLGDLLVLAGLLSNATLNEALKTSQHLNLPLGRILVLKNILKEHIVEAALSAQVMLRDGIIDRKTAVNALKNAKQSHSSIENCLTAVGVEIGSKRQSVRIGELFVLAEIIGESDLLAAVEIGLNEGTQIGQILMQFGFINEDTLEATLKLQHMVHNHTLSVSQAVTVLKQFMNGLDIARAVASITEPEVNPVQAVGLAELLHLAGLVPQEDTEKALAISYASKIPFNKILLQYNVVEESALQVAIRCLLLMGENLLTAEQAIVALHHCVWSGLELVVVLSKMGWMEEQKKEQTKNSMPIILGSTPITYPSAAESAFNPTESLTNFNPTASMS